MAAQITKTLSLVACGAALIAAANAIPRAAASEKPYRVVDGNSIPKPLTAAKGDPVRGKKVAINRKQGNCLACHIMPIPDQQFHGEVGPDLSEVASIYSEGELRLRVVDPKVLNPDTIMPAFYRTEGLHRVMKNFQGKSVLTAQQVEDVVAYLMTLK